MPTIENLERMLARGQDGALLRYSLGTEHLKLGHPAIAAEHLRKTVELDPEYSAAWRELGKALAASGQIDEALESYRRGIEIAEKRGDIQAAKEMRVFVRRLERSTD